MQKLPGLYSDGTDDNENPYDLLNSKKLVTKKKKLRKASLRRKQSQMMESSRRSLPLQQGIKIPTQVICVTKCDGSFVEQEMQI